MLLLDLSLQFSLRFRTLVRPARRLLWSSLTLQRTKYLRWQATRTERPPKKRGWGRPKFSKSAAAGPSGESNKCHVKLKASNPTSAVAGSSGEPTKRSGRPKASKPTRRCTRYELMQAARTTLKKNLTMTCTCGQDKLNAK